MTLLHYPGREDVHLRELLKTLSWGRGVGEGLHEQFNHFNIKLSLDNIILPWLKHWFHSKFYIHVNVYEK